MNDLIKSILVLDLGREDKMELNGCIVYMVMLSLNSVVPGDEKIRGGELSQSL